MTDECRWTLGRFTTHPYVLERFVKKRKRLDPEFAEGFEVDYSIFKVGVLRKQAREKAGMTQDDVAED